MKFAFFLVASLWLTSTSARSICKPSNILKPNCGVLPNSQFKSLANIVQDTQKNIEPEEYVTTTDSSGINTSKYHAASAEKSSANSIRIKINSDITFQKMTGFGGSITESCLENLKRLSPAAKKSFFENLFDRKNGAGFSYLRVPIGANDFSMGDYTLNDTPNNIPDPQFKHYNEKKLEGYMQFINEAKKYNPDLKVIMSPWTPPAWMKDTKSLKGGQIKKEHYDSYANYLVKTINEFERKGINIDQMTIMNEPLIGSAKEKWFFPQGYMSAEDQDTFIHKNLTPKLSGKKTKILLHDHNWDNSENVESFLNKKNPRVEGMAYHCYGGNFSNLQKNLEKNPGVPAYNTECTSTLNRSSDQETFDWWQNTQSVDAVKAGVSGSLGWNLCLDETGGPKNNGCKDCRGMVTIDSKTNQMTFNPEFKALATTSKVLDVGSVRIDSQDSNPNVTSVAFKNPDGSLSLILKNKSATSQVYEVAVDDCNLKRYHLPKGATLSARWFPN